MTSLGFSGLAARRLWLGIVALWIVSTLAAAERKTFDIPAGAAEETLKAFIEQSGAEVVYPAEIARGVRTVPVKGEWTAEQAIRQLLDGSGLTVRLEKRSRTFMIAREREPNVRGAATAPRQARAGEERGADDRALVLDEVEVTGPRVEGLINKGLIATDENSSLPYEVITRQEIEQLGATSIEEVFRYTPQITTYSTPNQEAAVAQIVGPNLLSSNLRMRGFDAQQTTVLINGRRIARAQIAGLTGSSSGDLTRIPVSAIERIEILPQSGSAIYGGGAIGGVINVILRKNYSGSEISTYLGTSTGGGATEYRGTLLHGFSLNGGRTSGSITLDYKHRDPLSIIDRRAFLDRAVQRLPFESVLQNFTNAPGLIRMTAATGDLGIPGAPGARYALIPPGTSPAQAQTLTPASFTATAGRFDVSYDRFVDNIIYTPTDTISLHVTGEHRLIPDRVTLYAEFTYSSSRQEIRNPRIYGTGTLLRPSLTATSPLNPFRTGVTPGFVGRAIAINFLPIDIQSSGSDFRRDAYRLVAGAEGKLGERWAWTFDGTTEITEIKSDSQVGGDNIMLASFFGSTTSPATFPQRWALYNPLVDHRAYPIAPELNDRYFNVIAQQRYWQYASNVLARATGDIADLPAGMLKASAGGELYFWQYEGKRPYVFTSDLITLMGGRESLARDIAYQKQARTTQAFFGETTIPLLGKRWRPLPIESLALDLSGRHESANDSKSATTLASALKAAISPDVALRVSLTEGFFPPEQRDLYLSDFNSTIFQQTTTSTFVDPRRGNTSQTLSIINDIGPNPELRPETSISQSMGLIVTPRKLPGLRLSVDLWEIEKEDAIRSPTFDQLLANEVLLPGRITRGPNLPSDPSGWAGPIIQIDRRSINFSTIKTSGADTQLAWRIPTKTAGEFTVSGISTYTRKFLTQIAPGAPLTEAVETQTALKWRGRLSLLWKGEAWGAGITGRYTDSYLTDQTAPSRQFPNGTGLDGARIASDLVWDVQVNYRVPFSFEARGVRRLLSGTQWTLGALNVLDRMPPWHSTGYYSRFSDPRMRYVYLQTKKSF